MLDIQKNEFKKYFEKFDTTNENISRKYHHSIRVMNHAIEIAKTLNLSESMIEIVGIAGLLHDIGRFEQWKMYETFSDLNSVNHAELGVEILKRNSYIKKYVFNSDYEDIIFKAIFEHNRYKISEGLDSNEEMVCKIIRDADKLDIMENQGNYVQPNIIFHEEILENIYKRQCCVNSSFENDADKVIKYICFIFDINFQYSFRYIREKNILGNKFQILENCCPTGLNLCDVEKNLDSYLNEQIM